MSITRIKLIAFSCLFVTILKSAVNEPVQNSSLKIYDSFINSFPHAEEKQELDIIDGFKKGIWFQEAQLNPRQLAEKAAEIVGVPENSCETSHDLAGRLNLLEGETFKTLTSNINTFIGKASFIKSLHTPTNNSGELVQKQNAVKACLENDAEFSRTALALAKIKEIEEEFFTIFAKTSKLNEFFFSRLYFRFFEKLNKNPLGLEISSHLETITTVGSPVILGCLGLAGLAAESLHIAHQEKPEATFRQKIHNAQKIARSQIAALAQQITFAAKNDKTIVPIAALYIASLAYVYYLQINEAWWKKKADLYLQKRLIAVRKLFENVAVLADIANNNPYLSNLPELQGLFIFEKIEQQTPSFQQFVELLASDTFSSASYFSSCGKIRTANKLLFECLEELKNICRSVAAFDVINATALLIKQSAHLNAHFTLPTFIFDANKPQISTSNFWNPAIHQAHVVPNSIVIDGSKQNPLHSVVTGPNTGGKTTVLKSLMTNVWLAQTIGIVAAESFEFTPFKPEALYCYLSITDDITTGQSLFAAEVNRIKRLVESFNALAPNEFGFAILDEIFTGTGATEASQAAVMLLDTKITKFKNCISLTATHFPALTEIPGIKNYKVTVHRNADGSLHRPFLLEEGVSDVNIAFDIINQAGLFDTTQPELVATA